ncbi:MAG TPA: hypothetical protein VD994_20040 [Prosthecobacter sp.]|nr:hypothetical protein [Prosthecobacter sp.]
MEFSLDVHTLAGTEPIQTKHQRLFEAWVQAAGDGGWRLSKVPPVPGRFGGGVSASRAIRFNDRRTRGYVDYVLRLPASPFECDSLHIKFTPTPENYLSLIDDIIPAILRVVAVRDFTLGHAEFAEPEVLADGVVIVNGRRACGGTLYPVFFMSEETSMRKFGLGSAEMARRLEAVAEQVQVVGGGVYVVSSRRLLLFAEALKLTEAMESALKPRQSASSRISKMFGFLTRGRRSDEQRFTRRN